MTNTEELPTAVLDLSGVTWSLVPETSRYVDLACLPRFYARYRGFSLPSLLRDRGALVDLDSGEYVGAPEDDDRS